MALRSTAFFYFYKTLIIFSLLPIPTYIIEYTLIECQQVWYMQILIFIVLVGNTGLGVVIILTPLLCMRLMHVALDIIQTEGEK